MFFYLSKILWFVAAPSNLLFLLLVAAVGAFALGRPRAGRRMTLLAMLLYGVLGLSPLGFALMRPLEDRFTRPALEGLEPTGIIVLGGAVDQIMSHARGTRALNESGARMTEAAILAHRFPKAKLVFSGGSDALFGSKFTEAEVARDLFVRLGVAPDRILLEDQSRNTQENADFTKRLVQRKPGEVWLLVTSASHMPRSVGLFRKAGFPVTPYPVDYVSSGGSSDFWAFPREAHGGLKRVDRAVREWIGLTAYYLTGRIDTLLPGPLM